MSTKARMEARRLIHHFAIDEAGAVPVEIIACDQGLLAQEKPIRGAEGRLVCGESTGVVTVNANVKEPSKKRFVIAHELGHFLLHRKRSQYPICDESAFLDWHRSRPHETEANVFAAELLMPGNLFCYAAAGTTMSAETIELLSGLFEVSFTSAALRYTELDIVPCAVVYSQDREIKWYRCSDSFRYSYIPVGKKVSPISGAGEYFEKDINTREAEKTLFEAWFADDNLVLNEYCYEQCIIMPSYNGVLSLIWEY